MCYHTKGYVSRIISFGVKIHQKPRFVILLFSDLKSNCRQCISRSKDNIYVLTLFLQSICHDLSFDMLLDVFQREKNCTQLCTQNLGAPSSPAKNLPPVVLLLQALYSL